MSIHRKATKRDANEADIVSALQAVGATVVRLSERNVPDLLVGWHGTAFLLEVKAVDGKVSSGQHNFLMEWQGGKAGVVRSVEDALKLIGAIE